MKSSSWMLVTFAVAVTASLVAAKSLLTVTERSQAAVQTQTQFIPIAESTQPILVGHRQPPAPAPWAKARPTAEVTKGQPSVNSDGTWTVLVVHGDSREYVTYRSMRRITPVN